MSAEGRGSSAEAFLRERACGSSSFQEPWLSTCKPSQLCVIANTSPRAKSRGLTTTLEPGTKPPECFQQHISSWDHSGKLSQKTSPGTRRSRKLSGRSAEAQHATRDPYPYLCFQNPFFTPMGKPQRVAVNAAACSCQVATSLLWK